MFEIMSELSDKILGWTMSTVGAGGLISAIGLVAHNPENMLGYTGAIAGAGCLGYGIDYLKKAYSK